MSQVVELMNAVKSVGLSDTNCFTNFSELIQSLVDSLVLEIPRNITNVVVGNIQPGDTQRDAVWFRKNNAGVFVGIYLYSDGTWRQFFPVIGQVYKIVGGDSRNPPIGFILTSSSNRITSDEQDKLELEWLRDPTDTFYTIFHVVQAPS